MNLGDYNDTILYFEYKLIYEQREDTNMIYGYARVSTKGQAKDGNSLEAQEQELRANGASIIYKDGYTGTKADRPQFNALLGEIKSGDTLIVCKLDRFARNAEDAIHITKDLVSKEITVNILNMGIADNSPMGKLMITILSGFAEFERDLIIERTQEGKAIARQKEGYREGRPKKFSKEQIKHALELLKDHSYKQVEAMTGISKSTLIRAKRNKLKN